MGGPQHYLHGQPSVYGTEHAQYTVTICCSCRTQHPKLAVVLGFSTSHHDGSRGKEIDGEQDPRLLLQMPRLVVSIVTAHYVLLTTHVYRCCNCCHHDDDDDS